MHGPRREGGRGFLAVSERQVNGEVARLEDDAVRGFAAEVDFMELVGEVRDAQFVLLACMSQDRGTPALDADRELLRLEMIRGLAHAGGIAPNDECLGCYLEDCAPLTIAGEEDRATGRLAGTQELLDVAHCAAFFQD